MSGKKQRAAINRLTKSVRHLIAQSEQRKKQMDKTQGMVLRLIAVSELLIAKGIISHGEINEKVKSYLDKRAARVEEDAVQSAGAGADAGDIGNGEPGLLSEESVGTPDGESDDELETERDSGALDEGDSTADVDEAGTGIGGIDGEEDT